MLARENFLSVLKGGHYKILKKVLILILIGVGRGVPAPLILRAASSPYNITEGLKLYSLCGGGVEVSGGGTHCM